MGMDLIGAIGRLKLGALFGTGSGIPVGSATRSHVHRFYTTVEEKPMNSIIYIVGLVVVIGAVLAFLGLR